MTIKVGDQVTVNATEERGLVLYVAASFAMVKVEHVEVPINFGFDEITVIEGHIYRVGDCGYLVNGIDTYRIVANDVMRQDGSAYLLALVVNNSHSNPGYENISEQSMGYNRLGRHPLDYQFGGVTGYNLLPPGTTVEPKPQNQALPTIQA